MDSNNTSSTKLDVYQIVTDRIIALLEQGTVPWQKPWAEAGVPENLLSKRPYRGINLWLLLSLSYVRNLFLSWDQLKKLGGSVKKGEHGHVVIYWKTSKKDVSPEENEKQKNVPLLRYYKVYNISQCRDIPDNLVEPMVVKEHEPIHECESIIHLMPQCPVIKHKEQKAFYNIEEDYINMPKKKSFKSIESYYTTLFHELVHSTGAEKRLNRKSVVEMHEFGSEAYSIEELVAEMGSAYLSSFSGVLNAEIKNTAAYIYGWLGKLKNDKRFIIQASGHAQRAVDFILNLQMPNTENKEEVEQSELLTKE